MEWLGLKGNLPKTISGIYYLFISFRKMKLFYNKYLKVKVRILISYPICSGSKSLFN